MNGVNLIPVHRLSRRRRAARVRLWMSIAPLCISALAGSYGYFVASWETRSGDLAATLVDTEAAITLTKRQVGSGRASLSEAQARLRANNAISNQPDWGLLLDLLARQLGDSAVLSSCVLEPMAAAAPPVASQPDKTGATKPAAVAEVSPRPERYRLTLAGIARTQEAVPLFVQRLHDTGLFETTKMIEAVRTPFVGGEAFRFQVECSISDSPVENP